MNKKITCSLLAILIIFIITGCNINQREDNNYIDLSAEVIKTLKITINSKEYVMELDNNETAKAFVNMLPQKLNMKELNGNEKYVYLEKSLPINSSNPKHINSGDLMLYGTDCLVIFYKSFDTWYNYTKIGHINNLPDLGNSDIIVKIEK